MGATEHGRHNVDRALSGSRPPTAYRYSLTGEPSSPSPLVGERRGEGMSLCMADRIEPRRQVAVATTPWGTKANIIAQPHRGCTSVKPRRGSQTNLGRHFPGLPLRQPRAAEFSPSGAEF